MRPATRTPTPGIRVNPVRRLSTLSKISRFSSAISSSRPTSLPNLRPASAPATVVSAPMRASRRSQPALADQVLHRLLVPGVPSHEVGVQAIGDPRPLLHQLLAVVEELAQLM